MKYGRSATRRKKTVPDVWAWTAIDAESKLIPSWRIGPRDAKTAFEFMHDLAKRLSNRIQLTTDGNRVYLNATESAFGYEIDYAILVKIYGHDGAPDTKYRPAECVDAKPIAITGKSEAASYLHELRGEAEFDDANEHATIYAADERILKESRKSGACSRAPLHALQFLPRPSDLARYSGNGSGCQRPRLDNRGNCEFTAQEC